MSADKRGWIWMIAFQAIVGVTAMTSQANSEEPLFLLTSQIERIGGETPTADSNAAAEEQASSDNSLRYDELRLTGPVDGESLKWRLIRVGDGMRGIVPAVGPAPITLDFAFPPAWDGESDRVKKQYDHPTTPTPPRRDDSNLLAVGTVDSMTLPFIR